MKRREFITLLGGGAAALPLGRSVRAQQSAMPVVGFLHSETPDAIPKEIAAFKDGLNEAGYGEGQKVTVEYRWAEGRFDRVPELLADLIRRDVAVIVAGGGTVTSVKAAGTSIPTVFTTGSDPVTAGLVPSLSRPGGNMTGVAFFVTAMVAKQLEMLLAVVPSAKIIGIASDPGYPWSGAEIDELKTAARTLDRKLIIQSITSDAQIESAFAAFDEQRVDALIVGGEPLFNRWHEKIVAQAARHSIPTCYGWRVFVAAGGLMSYGADLAEAYHQVGVYTARILKGAKPADLPVVQTTKVELVLNLKTAKALGRTVPLTLLGRADEVIE